MDRPAWPGWWRLAAAGIVSSGVFLARTLPNVPSGPVIGTGQDEWYNMIRGLQALYERLNPSYFIHPALYYELLALLYGLERLVLSLTGRIAGGSAFLDYFVRHEWQLLDLARSASVGCGVLAVLAAVWLGALLWGPGAGLLAGLVVASLPLLQAMATSIRVDALALATWTAATALIVRRYQPWERWPRAGSAASSRAGRHSAPQAGEPPALPAAKPHYRSASRSSLVLAAAGIGVAAAANYPGALLLVLLGWFEWSREGDDDFSQRARRFAAACGLAFAVFIVLNPYVIIDLPQFLRWFSFQASVALATHPHAAEPSAWRYLDLLRDQGPPAVLACLAGVLAIVRPRRASGALGAFGLLYLAAFSAMRSQYDRFALPAVALLCIAGVSWVCAQLAGRISHRIATGFVAAAALLILSPTAARFLRDAPRSDDPGVDYRAEMFRWIVENVRPTATLVFESDTLPLLQTVYDPEGQSRPFQVSLREAFARVHPHLPGKIIKAQFIAALYNYDPKLLDDGQVFFLASSQNREYIAANRAILAEPAAFYDALDTRATVVHETAGFHERLLLYAATAALN